MKPLYMTLGSMMLAATAYAQQPPPAGAPGGAPPPPPPGDRADRPEGRGGGPAGPGGPGGPAGQGGAARRDRGPGGPGGPDREGPGDFERRPGPGGEGMGMRGDGGGGGAGDPRMQRFELMRGYLDAVDRYARMAHNPNHAGIAAVVSAGDILKPRGTDAAIEYFTKTLPEVKSPAVQRAVRLHLVDLYKQAGKQDQALEQLKLLMTAEPGANESDATPAPAPPR